jgi:NAD(P)-dependent dehydrogenase (short-subunit alcohol dehydrogenase family)
VNRLQGKTAIVTGASANIGGALAAGLAAEGARVICTDIVASVAEKTANAITEAGGEAFALCGDVTDAAHAADVVHAAVSRWGGVDILVNNAMMFNHKGLLTMPVEEFRQQLEVCLTGALVFTRAVAECMISSGSGGSVINILSTAAWQGQPGNIGYSTAKSGLLNFTRSAAMELAEYGIRVNGFTPTVTQPSSPEHVQLIREAKSSERRYPNDFYGLMPMGDLPSPADYVPSVVFLASDDSRMITGSNITVDGGATAKYWPWVPRR